MLKPFLAGLVCVLLLGMNGPAAAAEPTRIFFLHNSVGLGLIEEGAIRASLESHNDGASTPLVFWDHNYPYIGLCDPEGELLGYPYSSVCGHNTNPDGLHELWLSTLSHYAAARDSILTHDVIAFKSCYRACDFDGASTEQELAAALAQYKDYYLAMRDVFAQHPDKTFIAMSFPPRHRLHAEQSVARAAHARQFANWLKSPEFIGDPPRPNIRVFDLFDLLAAPDDGSPTANMLRFEYERSHTFGDSHPNAQGNATAGPLFTQALIEATDTAVDVENRDLGGVKSLFR
jgi:hypothetical protein